MKTHTELLKELIEAIYETTAFECYELYKLSMLAAEIKGQMMASEPQPDSDED